MGWLAVSRIWLLAAVASAVALSACATTGNPDPIPSPTSPVVPGASAATDHEPTRQEQVTALWQDLHAQLLAQIHADGEPDGERFAGLATAQAIESLVDLIVSARGDLPTDLVDSELWTETIIAPDGDAATISDCVLVATRPAAQADSEPTVRSRAWTGTAVETADGWLIDSITPGVDNCVPAELNRQLLDAYHAWHEAKNQWWDPPDPAHPLLERIMVDPGLGDARELLVEHREMGIVVRDDHDLENAVVFDLGIGTARISDCFLAHPDNITAYDLETGERREDLSPSPSPDQIDRTVVDFERFSNGEWKARGWRSTSNNDCTPGGTPYVVAP